MNTLSRRPLWLAIGWSLVLVVTVLSLMPVQQLPEVSYNDKIGHLLAYFSMMAWFGQIHERRPTPVFALLAMGALLEVLQGWSGYRDMSGLDMLANAAGVALGWLFSRRHPGLLAKLEARLQ